MGSRSLGTFFGFHFGAHFWRVWGSFLDPKWDPKSDFLGFLFWSSFGFSFCRIWGPFWITKRPKRDQDGLQKQSKRAIIAKRSNFEKVCFDMFFCSYSGASGFPREAQEGQEGFQDGSRESPRPFKNLFHFSIALFRLSEPILGSKTEPRGPQNGVQTWIPKKSFWTKFEPETEPFLVRSGEPFSRFFGSNPCQNLKNPVRFHTFCGHPYIVSF